MSTQSTIIHGVFIKIFNIGVLLIGKPGIGKSELALGLINRGHKLIADDVVEFYVRSNYKIIGKSPDLLRNFLSIRDIGIINVKRIFGPSVVKTKNQLQLVIELINGNIPHPKYRFQKILAVEIPRMTICINSNRNGEMLVETAIYDFILKRKGYNANFEFNNNQQKLIGTKK